MEGVLEPGEPRIGVDEDRVEVAVGDQAGTLVVGLLAGSAPDEDVAHAAGHERARGPGGARGVEQRHELGGELLAPEREHLDEQHGGARRAQVVDQHPAPQREGVVDREAGVAADDRASGGHAERR